MPSLSVGDAAAVRASLSQDLQRQIKLLEQEALETERSIDSLALTYYSVQQSLHSEAPHVLLDHILHSRALKRINSILRNAQRTRSKITELQRSAWGVTVQQLTTTFGTALSLRFLNALKDAVPSGSFETVSTAVIAAKNQRVREKKTTRGVSHQNIYRPADVKAAVQALKIGINTGRRTASRRGPDLSTAPYTSSEPDMLADNTGRDVDRSATAVRRATSAPPRAMPSRQDEIRLTPLDHGGDPEHNAKHRQLMSSPSSSSTPSSPESEYARGASMSPSPDHPDDNVFDSGDDDFQIPLAGWQANTLAWNPQSGWRSV